MKSKLLFIFIEGDDDERFFQRILKPLFEKKYDSVMLYKYAQKKSKDIINFLGSISSMNADYIFVADINGAPCISNRKEKVKKKFNDYITYDRIVVVIKEIESWYLAGLDDDFLKKYKIKLYSATDDITKEQFESLIPKKFDSKIDFMIEILNHFSIHKAKQRNKSFNYFFKKFI